MSRGVFGYGGGLEKGEGVEGVARGNVVCDVLSMVEGGSSMEKIVEHCGWNCSD